MVPISGVSPVPLEGANVHVPQFGYNSISSSIKIKKRKKPKFL